MVNADAKSLAESLKRYRESVESLRQDNSEENVIGVNRASRLCLANLLDKYMLNPFDSSGNYVFDLFYRLSEEGVSLIGLSGEKFSNYYRAVEERLKTAITLRKHGIEAFQRELKLEEA